MSRNNGTYTELQCANEPARALSTRSFERVFIWNCRECQGTELHVAALEGDFNKVKRCLQDSLNKRELLHTRFLYETEFNGKVQEGSGEPIHLAVSRGHMEVTKYLLNEKAELSDCVNRDHDLPHYDVLHAAMFAEGRGGTPEMIRFLCEAKAEMSRNLDGRHPLHIAFMTGNMDAITSLREYCREYCMRGDEAGSPSSAISQASVEDACVDVHGAVPLSLGISSGKMSENQLSEAATITLESLRTFINEAPQCIPSFLVRFKEATHISATDLAKSLTRLDISEVLKAHPKAGTALLDHATAVPLCTNEGHHALPARVSFAPRSLKHKINLWLNPRDNFFTFYQPEYSWNFDSVSFTAPEWHETLTNRKHGPPIIDAEVGVCHIPDLLCAQVFDALCRKQNLENRELYSDIVVQAMIKHIFWNGCYKVEATCWLLNLWGLALLMAEQWYYRQIDAEELQSDRRLRHAGGVGSFQTDKPDGALLVFQADEYLWISFAWIYCKVFVDLLLELIQFGGFRTIGRCSEYIDGRLQLFDIFGKTLMVALATAKYREQLLVIAIITYWTILLFIYPFAEKLATEFLPIIALLRELVPALCVTIIAFGAFTHAFYVADGSNDIVYPDVFLESFNTLLTATMPETGSTISKTKLCLTFGAVVFFSVFILNIFIGVIGEQYSVQKENVAHSFRTRRAVRCKAYLLRSNVLPCQLLSNETANIIMCFTVVCVLAVQVYSFYDYQWRLCVFFAFVAGQLTLILCSFQNPEAEWIVNRDGPEGDYFVWFCKQMEVEEPDALTQEVQELRGTLTDMKGQIEFMKQMLDEDLR